MSARPELEARSPAAAPATDEVNRRELVNGFTHLAGALLAVVGLAVLLRTPAARASGGAAAALAIFGASLIMLYASSAVHHLAELPPRAFDALRRVDHIMIYVLIAGTYTPVCALLLEGRVRVAALSIMWGAAALGTVQKVAWMHGPRWLSTALYIAMGWAGAVAIPLMRAVVPARFFWWVLAGGLFYTVGAVIYNLQRPNPWPGRLGSHELWHLFVLAGSASHFWAILHYVAQG